MRGRGGEGYTQSVGFTSDASRRANTAVCVQRVGKARANTRSKVWIVTILVRACVHSQRGTILADSGRNYKWSHFHGVSTTRGKEKT